MNYLFDQLLVHLWHLEGLAFHLYQQHLEDLGHQEDQRDLCGYETKSSDNS